MTKEIGSVAPFIVSLQTAKTRLLDGFYHAGHAWAVNTIESGTGPDYELFMETWDWLHDCCLPTPRKSANSESLLSDFRLEVLEDLQRVAMVLDKHSGDEPKLRAKKFLNALPEKSAVLAVRFASSTRAVNKEIFEQLVAMKRMDLWQIPLATDTTEESDSDSESDSETRSDRDGDSDSDSDSDDEADDKAGVDNADGDSNRKDAPSEAESSADDSALTESERRANTMKELKKQLAEKLAAMSKAESAVVLAQYAMSKAQDALAEADSALLDTPMGGTDAED